MRRREFIAALGSSMALARPVLGAGPSTAPLIGFLSARSTNDSTRVVGDFRQGLAEMGYVPGRNCAIEFRWAEGRYGNLPALAAELLRQRVAVLATAGGTQAASAAKAATRTVPVVFAVADDPVERGLVRRLNRPEGNVTGATFFSVQLGGKRLGLLRELVPGAKAFGFLVNSARPQGQSQTKDVLQAAQELGVQVTVAGAETAPEIDRALADLAQQRISALLVATDPSFDIERERLVALPNRLRLPALYSFPDFPVAGGLMSYGASIADAYRQAGVYVGRILKGARPGELPVVQPTKFELVINLKTATALGLTLPPSLLARADQVIE